MTDEAPKPFGKEHAANYDRQFARLAPMKDALHLLTRLTLEHLHEDAHVLVAGAGTGAELLYLAKAFPSWRFTALDVAEAMLEQCRAAVADAGIEDRVVLHLGPVASLDETPTYHAATSFLVSHFLLEPAARVGYFRDITRRLRPGARLVTADLCFDPQGPAFEAEYELWQRMLCFSGSTPEQAAGWASALGSKLNVLPREQHAQALRDAGLLDPRVFCQTLWIHGWIADRA